MTGSIEVDYQPQPIFTKHIEQPPFKYTSNRLEHRAVDKYALKMGLLIRAGAVALFMADPYPHFTWKVENHRA
jgi:hypothetical protein